MVTVENDAVFVPPGMGEVEACARREKMEPAAACDLLLERRSRVIGLARKDPFRYGYEPDFWLVCRALLGMRRIPDVVRYGLAERTGMDEARCWENWSDALLSGFKMRKPVMELLANGANAAGKTDFAAKVSHELAQERGRKIVIGSQTRDMSVEVQQSRVWRYMPEEWRRNCVIAPEYIKYTDKNGFTKDAFINKAGTRFKFVSYAQEMEDAFEGTEGHLYWMDEEVPQEWVNTIRYRIARVRGKLLVTFTPISGYTPAVADYQDEMRVVRWCHGYMLPRDGMEPAPWAAIGLTRGEMRELERWTEASEKAGAVNVMPQTVPNGRAEDCVGWVRGRSSLVRECESSLVVGEGRSTLVRECDSSFAPAAATDDKGSGSIAEIGENAVPGRVWERVPRVALCRDDNRAVVWFHGSDNPYGKPLENIKKAAANPQAREEIRTRIYGIARKISGKRFKAFDVKVHVV